MTRGRKGEEEGESAPHLRREGGGMGQGSRKENSFENPYLRPYFFSLTSHSLVRERERKIKKPWSRPATTSEWYLPNLVISYLTEFYDLLLLLLLSIEREFYWN